MPDTSILGKEVSIDQIDAELNALWDEDDTSAKASLINFAVYSEAPDALVDNTPVIAEITREHACRAILIAATLDAPESSARSWVTAHCNLIGGKKAACSEQVAIQLIGNAIGRIRNILFAHLASDLPLVLWWQGDFSRIFEPKFFSQIDRLIIDSDSWQQPLDNIEKLASSFEVAPKEIVIHDLSWTRSHQFRLAIASLFDDPQARAALPEMESVVIAHAENHRTTGLLVAAWLATQLEWSRQPHAFDTKDRLTFTTADGKRTVAVHLESTDGDSPALSKVELHAGENHFRVRRTRGERYIRTRLALPNHRIDHVLPADRDTQAELVSDQLERGGDTSLLRKVLPEFLEIVRAL